MQQIATTLDDYVYTPDDTLVEGDELATLTPSGDNRNGRITYTANSVTIVDADIATVAFQSATTTVDEDDSATLITVVLSTAGNTLENDTTIQISAAHVTTEDADFSTWGNWDETPKTVTFADGAQNGATRTVSINPANDNLVEGDETEDLLLRHGDLITVPTARDFISVLGMVSSPGNIPYAPGWAPRDYLTQAGGFAEKAAKGDTRVIRAEVHVQQEDIAGVELGSPVRVVVWAYPDLTFHGEVVAIAPVANETSDAALGEAHLTIGGSQDLAVRVTTEIPNPDGALKSEMSGYGKIATGHRPVWDVLLRPIIRWFQVEVWSWIP
mgnify:CR=1 FL=1